MKEWIYESNNNKKVIKWEIRKKVIIDTNTIRLGLIY